MPLPLGESFIVDAVVSPADASNRNIIWGSDNPSVAAVNQHGVVNGVSVGQAVITATTEEGGFSATCTVNVYIPVSGISITDGPVLLPLGESTTLTAEISPADATDKTVIWSSSASSIASVDSNGTITGHDVGSALITARTVCGNFTDTCLVNIVIPVTGVSIDGSNHLLPINTSMGIQAHITPNDATNQTLHWDSSNPSAASVDEHGTVTGHTAGETEITTTTADGGFTASTTVSVIIPVTNISLTENTLLLPHHESHTLTADATIQTIHWMSSDSSVVSVDSNGIITGHSLGSAVITATTENGGFSDVCLVTVVTPVTGVSLTQNAKSIYIYQTSPLTAVISPLHATNQMLH